MFSLLSQPIGDHSCNTSNGLNNNVLSGIRFRNRHSLNCGGLVGNPKNGIADEGSRKMTTRVVKCKPKCLVQCKICLAFYNTNSKLKCNATCNI